MVARGKEVSCPGWAVAPNLNSLWLNFVIISQGHLQVRRTCRVSMMVAIWDLWLLGWACVRVLAGELKVPVQV